MSSWIYLDLLGTVCKISAFSGWFFGDFWQKFHISRRSRYDNHWDKFGFVNHCQIFVKSLQRVSKTNWDLSHQFLRILLFFFSNEDGSSEKVSTSSKLSPLGFPNTHTLKIHSGMHSQATGLRFRHRIHQAREGLQST